MKGFWKKSILSCILAAIMVVTLAGSTAAVKAEGKPQMKRTYGSQNPMYTMKVYMQDNIVDMWEKVPEDMKDNTVIWIVGNAIKESNSEVKAYYLQQANAIEDYNKAHDKKIYYIMQALNGETPATDHISVDYWEQFMDNGQYPCMLGLNAAELYNSTPWAASNSQFNIGNTSSDPDKYGNHASYLADLIDLCGDYGMYFMWSDANRSGATGKKTQVPVVNRWLENREWVENGTGAIGSYMTNVGRTYGSKYHPDSIQNDLLSTMKNNHANVILVNKESFGHPATDSLFYGLWLAGYCDNWGASSDWWHWGIHGNSGESQTWKNITRYVDELTAQSIVRVANQGATVFNNEASWFTNAITNPDIPVDAVDSTANRIGTYQYAVLPLLERIKNGAIEVPSKEECLSNTKLLCVGADSWRGIYMNDGTSHTRENGDIFPKEGRYGLTPIIPATMDTASVQYLQQSLPAEAKTIGVLNNISQELIGQVEAAPGSDTAYQEMLNSLYPKEYVSSNTYLNRTNNTWWWYGWNENGGTYQSKFAPKQAAANRMQIDAGPYITGIITEKSTENKINVYLNNYRIDKTALNGFTGDMGGAPSPADKWWYDTQAYPWGASGQAYEPQMRTRKWINDNLTVKLENGVPVTEGTGSGQRVKTAADTILKDNTLYTSTIQVKGTYMGGAPSVVYNNKDNGDAYSRYYSTEESWNADTQVLTVEIQHNGQVDFDILVDQKSEAPESSSNVAAGKVVTTSGTYTTGEGARPIQWITDGDKSANNYVDIHAAGSDKRQLQWIQVDLAQSYSIDQINLWRYYTDQRTYPVTIAMVSDDPNFTQEADTEVFFNSCSNPASQSWPANTPEWIQSKAGSDAAYSESGTGKAMLPVNPASGRYVRIYSRSNDDNSGDNHFVEVEVLGK